MHIGLKSGHISWLQRLAGLDVPDRDQSPVLAVAVTWPKLIFNSFGAEAVAEIWSVSSPQVIIILKEKGVMQKSRLADV